MTAIVIIHLLVSKLKGYPAPPRFILSQQEASGVAMQVGHGLQSNGRGKETWEQMLFMGQTFIGSTTNVFVYHPATGEALVSCSNWFHQQFTSHLLHLRRKYVLSNTLLCPALCWTPNTSFVQQGQTSDVLFRKF
jgi:hypothetical protein